MRRLSIPWVCPGVNVHGSISGGRFPCDLVLSVLRSSRSGLGVLVPTGSSERGWGRRRLVCHATGALPAVPPAPPRGAFPQGCLHGSTLPAGAMAGDDGAGGGGAPPRREEGGGGRTGREEIVLVVRNRCYTS